MLRGLAFQGFLSLPESRELETMKIELLSKKKLAKSALEEASELKLQLSAADDREAELRDRLDDERARTRELSAQLRSKNDEVRSLIRQIEEQQGNAQAWSDNKTASKKSVGVVVGVGGASKKSASELPKSATKSPKSASKLPKSAAKVSKQPKQALEVTKNPFPVEERVVGPRSITTRNSFALAFFSLAVRAKLESLSVGTSSYC